MTRWTNENDFDPAVESAAATYGLPPELVKAIISVETGFVPGLMRVEPGGLASVGLMQILTSTARSLGYGGPIGDGGTLSGLFDPATNIMLGGKLLRQLLDQTSGDLEATASAYNGGYRPALGFGGRRTATTPVVCLLWKPTAPATGRVISRDCQVVGSTVVGTFSNQPYIDKFRSGLDYFFVSAPRRAAYR